MRIKDMFVPIFKNYFLFLKTINTKNLFGERSVFLFFCVFYIIKNHFFENNKNMFSLFFHYSKNRLFFVFSLLFFLCFLSYFLCFHKGEFHPTTTPLPANLFFFLKLLKLIYLHMVTKSSFV